MIDNNIKKKTFILIALIIILNIFVSYSFLGYQHGTPKDDATTYWNAARFFQGKTQLQDVNLNRILTVPLFLVSSVSLDHFLNNLNLSISIINLFFYILCVFAFYFLALEIYKENKVAVFGTMLFSFNYYVIDPINAHLADMGGWLFFILATWLAVKYFNSSNRKFYYLSISLSAIGVLFKEYGGLGLINLALFIAVSGVSWRQKIKDILLAGILFLIPLFSYHIFVYMKYHFTYFDWYKLVGTASATPGYEARGLILFIKILGWLFSFGWLAFVLGIEEEWKAMDKTRIKILLAILPVTLFFLVWPAITQRLGVMFMMWLSLIAGFGLYKKKWYLSFVLVVIYVLINYNIGSLIKIINLPF
jgi:hypothetical protein